MRLRSLLLAAILLLAPSMAEAGCTLAKLAEIPVTMRGLRPTVTLTMNGKDAVFIVDSGAFYTMVDDEAVARFGLKPIAAPEGMRLQGAGGGSEAARAARAGTFSIAGVSFKDADFLVGKRAGDDEIVGLLGQNFLGIFDIEYDFANGFVRFFELRGCKGDLNLAYWAAGKPVSIAPLKGGEVPGVRFLMAVKTTAKVEGRTIDVQLDSGVSLSVLSLPAASRAGVKTGSQKLKAGGVSYGLFGRGMETWIAPFESFAIGSEEIQHTRLRVADIDLPEADMLLGSDFLLSHRVFVSRKTDKIFFTYNGGPVFKLDGAPPPARVESVDEGFAPSSNTAEDGKPLPAAEYARRAAFKMTRRDFKGAIADYGRAIEFEPKEPAHYKGRASARLAVGDTVQGLSDLDEALKLKPDAALYLVPARVHFSGGNKKIAEENLALARQLAPDDRDVGFEIAALYIDQEMFETAVRELDRSLSIPTKDASMSAEGLNRRCWARALWGRDLEKALEDCNLAIRRGGRITNYLDSRGLVLLRLGRLDDAIRDYDAVLKQQPNIAWSLYGRGLAKRRKGDMAGGDADIAGAKTIQPNIGQTAARYRIDPGAAGAASAKAAS